MTTWEPPERVWIYEACVLDCIDRGWAEEFPGPTTSKFRAREYVRAEVLAQSEAALASKVEQLALAERDLAERVEAHNALIRAVFTATALIRLPTMTVLDAVKALGEAYEAAASGE